MTMEATQPTESEALAVITIALEAEQGLAQKLRNLKAALEAGQESEAMRIAREITKARVRRAA
jgi:hypothetical protein